MDRKSSLRRASAAARLGFTARLSFAVLLGLATLLGFAAVTAQAQNPTAGAVAAARELIQAKGGAAMFEPAVPGVVESTKNSFLPTNPNLSRELNEVAAQLRKEYEAKKAELVYEVAIVYAKHFTEQELKELVAFYRSPLGQKMLKEEPVALDESFKRAQDWSIEFADVVMGRFRTEMKKRGHQL
jgi:hypothetical protein